MWSKLGGGLRDVKASLPAGYSFSDSCFIFSSINRQRKKVNLYLQPGGAVLRANVHGGVIRTLINVSDI